MTLDDTKPTLTSRRVLFSGAIVELAIERVQTDDRGALDMEIVRHPGSVVILAVSDDGQIVLVRQYRHAVDRWLWELPAGRVDPGERPEVAARRECHEETGFWPGRLDSLGTFYPTPGYCDELMMFFHATDLRRPTVAAPRDEHESLEVRQCSLAEAARLAREGDASDMKTVLGLDLLQRT